jgi:hypothetical protein
MRKSAAKGTLIMTVYGVLGDGAIALIDLRAAHDVPPGQEMMAQP